MIDFKKVSVFYAVLTLILSILLLVAPEFIFWIFQVEGNSSAFFLSRRASMLFLGSAFLAWTARNAVHSRARQAICLGFGVSMFTMGVLGSVEVIRGYAGIATTIPIIVEFGVAISFLKIWFSNKNTAISG